MVENELRIVFNLIFYGAHYFFVKSLFRDPIVILIAFIIFKISLHA